MPKCAIPCPVVGEKQKEEHKKDKRKKFEEKRN